MTLVNRLSEWSQGRPVGFSLQHVLGAANVTSAAHNNTSQVCLSAET